jgi:hypothetical protein
VLPQIAVTTSHKKFGAMHDMHRSMPDHLAKLINMIATIMVKSAVSKVACG